MRLERSRNHLFPIENGWTNSVFDMSLYDMAMREENLTLHLNTDVFDVELEDSTRGLEALGRWPVATDERGYWLRPACEQGKSISAVLARVPAPRRPWGFRAAGFRERWRSGLRRN